MGVVLSFGFLEIIFALSLRSQQGFTKLWPSIITAISGIGSLVCDVGA
jgi:quaternary ammonium compound-resistance protein SugE